MSPVLALTAACVALVVLFDYTNGFHDASSIIGAAIASRAMTPGRAVQLVAVFEFLGPVLAVCCPRLILGPWTYRGSDPELPS